ncbi:MAG: peptide-methionine (S)-S-oxide reductase MsrA [Gammaproteobacteria bacterium]|nr:peptide-methionine (S)-S-oxide reductase MsrA [Gammaproteobacteria bacterium]
MPQFRRNVLHTATLVVAALFATPVSGAEDDHAVATFAGGCFWCVEADFDAVDGVIATTSGYIGGHEPDPTYEQVSAGGTGHTEAVEIRYDPGRVSYRELLSVFWVNHDPTTNDRQFCDQGSQYRPGIFYHNAEQKRLAEESRREIRDTHPFDVVTEITEATTFYEAEEYHQDYYEKNPIRYKFYRYGCGRDARLEELWGGT